MKIDQFHGNFIHHFKVASPAVKPFVLGSLGWKTYNAKNGIDTVSKSFFSFALGGGVKYLFNDYFGLRGEARWSPSLLSVSDSSFWCEIGGQGAECQVQLNTSLHHQMDLTGGLIFRF
ncbi:MAG: hypothetical protein P8Z37_14215 [Acidobacteriota bacterium]